MNLGVSSKRKAATFLPPPAIGETAWDILLALHSDRACALDLPRLAGIASVPPRVLGIWLDRLERQHLITGVRHGQGQGQGLQAVLTPAGRALLDRYLAAASALQAGAYH